MYFYLSYMFIIFFLLYRLFYKLIFQKKIFQRSAKISLGVLSTPKHHPRYTTGNDDVKKCARNVTHATWHQWNGMKRSGGQCGKKRQHSRTRTVAPTNGVTTHATSNGRGTPRQVTIKMWRVITSAKSLWHHAQRKNVHPIEKTPRGKLDASNSTVPTFSSATKPLAWWSGDRATGEGTFLNIGLSIVDPRGVDQSRLKWLFHIALTVSCIWKGSSPKRETFRKLRITIFIIKFCVRKIIRIF
jgi:hypothetical protein